MASLKKLFLSRQDNGTILIAALWVLVFFVILSLGVSSAISARIRVFKKLEELVLGWPLARSACFELMSERAGRLQNFDSLADLSRVRAFSSGSGKAEYTLTDESARINLNTAPEEVLARLAGFTPDLARAVVSSGRPYAVPEQLRLVEGVDAEVWEKCRDFVTVYSDGKVNVNTASREVLAALGFDESLLGGVLDFRAGSDGIEGTPDDGVFEDAAGIAAGLAQQVIPSQAQSVLLERLSGDLAVRSSALRLAVRTFVRNRAGVDFLIVVDQSRIRQWREY